MQIKIEKSNFFEVSLEKISEALSRRENVELICIPKSLHFLLKFEVSVSINDELIDWNVSKIKRPIITVAFTIRTSFTLKGMITDSP